MGENNKKTNQEEKEFEEKIKLIIGRKRKRLEKKIKIENSTKMKWLNEEGIKIKSEVKKKEDENKQKEVELLEKKNRTKLFEDLLVKKRKNIAY